MKLSQIIKEDSSALIAPNPSSPKYYVSKKSQPKYNNILKENQYDYIKSMVNLTIDKIKSAMTASSDKDLEVLLGIMSPGLVGQFAAGNQSSNIDHLKTWAENSEESILSDDKWWEYLFKTLNISDAAMQNDIIQNVKKELGKAFEDKLAVGSINEAPIIDKLRDIGTSIVNPKLGAKKAKRASIKHQNIRVANLALQYAKLNLQAKFNSTLSSKGYRPENIIELYKTYLKLIPKIDNNNPKVMKKYRNTVKQLIDIFSIFNPEDFKSEDNTTPEVQSNPQETPQPPPVPDANPAANEPSGAKEKPGKTNFSAEQKAAGKDLVLRMGQVGRKAGQIAASKKLSDQEIYNAIKYSGKKIAQQYHKIDPDVAIAAYRYYSSQLQKTYKPAKTAANAS